MKANDHPRLSAIAALGALVVLAGSCSAPQLGTMPAPVAQSPPMPAAALPPPVSPPPREALDWKTAPITPGDWQWREEGGKSVARFAEGKLVLSCDRASGLVTIMRAGSASGPVAMTIMTSSTERAVTGDPWPGPPPVIATSFPARDSLLDAMAFSRGRFALQAAGLETLYVPSWPEVSRVVEDCR